MLTIYLTYHPSNGNNYMSAEPRRKREPPARPNHILLYTIINPAYPITVIEISEVIAATKTLKSGKSPGIDGITNEILKTDSETLIVHLTELFNLILNTGETPTQWSESDIILIYKKGDPNDIVNYRPISLLPTIYKLFSSIVNKRIYPTLEARQPVEQAGFRKGKAFDCVSHINIWESLTTQGVEKEYISVIKRIYNNSKSRFKLETAGPWFPIKRGVRQGDPLSPLLFLATLVTVISQLNWKGRGIKINDAYLSHLRFADDLVLLSETGQEIQYMLESLNNASKRVGLEINLSKTMLMTSSEKKALYLGSEPLKYTDSYIYLGKQISLHNSNDQEVERRTQLTWNKYWALKDIFKISMPVKIKTKVLNSCLIPCLTYACQTWKFNKKTKDKIITCQRGIERSMLNIRKVQKIRHTKIRNTTKDGLEHAQSLKWRWAGHVARLRDKRWTKTVTIWAGPQGKRKRGRPVASWEDDIKKTAGPNWIQVAQSREDWLSLEEAFTYRGVLTE
ncbi:unnamed protein product [Pieris macdunnoughi]|uniref:Reverse transcriptase domain-containing protein n=1 Tax=Pieris macdunnoughi TaxID=345717 RepID=A0A821UEX6_9NEOP|nr:unnamed protein product [Pieris macdunnoughi]